MGNKTSIANKSKGSDCPDATSNSELKQHESPPLPCGNDGTGDGNQLSYEEAALLRPDTVGEMWAIVKKTSDVEGMTLKPTRNRKGWKTIRVFVSSTFRDFYEEREVLVKEIFPDLRLWCEERRLRLIECDLRWGVPKGTSSEKTIQLCLEELDRCREENIEPYFLNLVGERTGWVPQYGDMSDNLASMYGWVYGLSVTEMEIVHGAFRRLNPNALFLIRTISELPGMPEKEKKAFFDRGEREVEKLKMLKSNITSRFPESCHSYHVNMSCKDGKVKVTGLSGKDSIFCKTITDFFKTRIAQQYPLDLSPKNLLDVQKAAHNMFLDSRSQHIFGRDQLIGKIEEYYLSDTSRSPLLLTGCAGAGKSAIMARCAKDAQYNAENDLIDSPDSSKTWKVFYHFVGAAPGSTDLSLFLQRLVNELQPDSKDTFSDLKAQVNQTKHLLSNEKALSSTPTIIFIDAINQFEEDEQHLLGQWLPERLSPYVKIVVSVIEGSHAHQTLRTYKPSPEEVVCGPLNNKSKKEMILNILKTYNKRLGRDQMNGLIGKSGANNPLWLTLACEELRVHGTFENVNDKIEGLPDDLIDLEVKVFERFESESGGPLMKATLCLLEVSRHGLLESELLALLADPKRIECPDLRSSDSPGSRKQNKEKIIQESTEPMSIDTEDVPLKYLPARDWAVIYRYLKPLLRPCGELGEGRLDFYHRSLSKAVRKKYFSGSDAHKNDVYRFWRCVLADYLVNISDMDRKAEELPYQLDKLQDSDRLSQCLLEWEVFNRLYDEVFPADLLRYWQKCGGYSVAANMYTESIIMLKRSSTVDIDFFDQSQKVGSFLFLAGQHDATFRILEQCISLNLEDSGKLADLYALMARCKDGLLNTMMDGWSGTHEDYVKERKKVANLCQKSNEHRKQCEGDEQDYERAKNNIYLSYQLHHIGDNTNSLKVIDKAIAALEKLNNTGMLAFATAYKCYAVSDLVEQEELLMKAREMCLKAYGKTHRTYVHICFNLSTVNMLSGKYELAYDNLMEAKDIHTELCGPNHVEVLQITRQLQRDVFDDVRERRERLTPGTA